MAQLLKTTIFLAFFLLLFSCSNNDEKLEADDSYTIEFGSTCGWCGGTTNISINKGEINYTRIIPCGENQGTKTDTQNFDSEKWDELTTCFDINLFKTLDYNTCNVCVDGCDEIIKITQDKTTHEIRYNPSESIEGLETLQEKLREYLAEFYQDN